MYVSPMTLHRNAKKTNTKCRLSLRRATFRALSISTSTSASLSRATLLKSSPLLSHSYAPVALGLRAFATRDGDASFGDRRSGFDAVRDAAAFDRPGRPQRSFDRTRAPREPREPAEPNPSVYVGNLLYETTQETLSQAFQQFGEIERVNLALDPNTGTAKGFGYVRYGSVEAAAAAIEAMQGREIDGRTVIVNFAHQRKPFDAAARPPRAPFVKAAPTKTLFIGNLSYDMTDQDIQDLFSQTKDVLDVRVAMDRVTGRPRGFAHADYLTQETADRAMAFLESQTMDGRQLRVNYGTPAVKRTFGRSGGPPRRQERDDGVWSESGTESTESGTESGSESKKIE